MSDAERFWWGAFGSATPHVIQFGKLAFDGDPLPRLNWVFWAIMMLVYGLVAGGVSVAWKPTSAYRAIWIGASFPALVGAIMQTPPRAGK